MALVFECSSGRFLFNSQFSIFKLQYYYDDTEFGRVIVSTRRGMRNYTARWKGDVLHANVPWGTDARKLACALDQMRQGLRAQRLTRPTLEFAIGQVIDCFGRQVRLTEQSHVPGRMLFGRDGDMLTLALPKGMDLNSDSGKRNITHGLQVMLEQEARQVLLPFADQVARQVGATPSRWEVGRGMTKLGHCTSQRVIQLSRNLMFLPERLVRYVICHELAHLTHMNHSPEFHALVDRYTGGQEKALEQELKRFKWPIVR